MKIFEITEAKVEMCPEACCGKPVTECACGPDCKHCDCHAKNEMSETDSILDPLKGAAAELFGKPTKPPEAPEKIALDQAMEKYKNKPTALRAWIMKNRKILLWLNTDGSQWMDMVKQTIGETATAGGTSAGAMATVANPPSANAKIKRKNGVPIAPQKKNKDGTAKNALELGNNLMGGGTVKR